MKEYRVEKQGVDRYKNGVYVFRQNAEPMCVTATAHIRRHYAEPIAAQTMAQRSEYELQLFFAHFQGGHWEKL